MPISGRPGSRAQDTGHLSALMVYPSNVTNEPEAHLRLVVIDVARSRMMQIIIDQRHHSSNVVHRWVVYIIIYHPYGSDRCHSKMRSKTNETN